MTRGTPAVAAYALLLTAPVALAATGGLPAALLACKEEKDDSRRLACYDREIARGAPQADESFGLTPQQQRKIEPPEAREKPKPKVLSSTVSTVRQRPDGRNVIVLANGETWVQGEAWERLSLRAGDAITIKPGLLGSFYLDAPSGDRIRVTRTQ